MKNKGLILTLIALSAACNKPAEQTDLQNSEAFKADIQFLENDNARWVNSKEVDSMVQYYADDAVSYDSNSKPLHGREEIRESMQSLSRGFENGASIKYTVTEVFPMSDGEKVLEIGHYKISDSRGKTYGSGNYFSLFEKRNGKYVCIRDIQTPDSLY